MTSRTLILSEKKNNDNGRDFISVVGMSLSFPSFFFNYFFSFISNGGVRTTALINKNKRVCDIPRGACRRCQTRIVWNFPKVRSGLEKKPPVSLFCIFDDWFASTNSVARLFTEV